MKKQGELYLKIISIVLAAVVLAYVLFSVLFKSGSSYALTAAVRCEVGDGMTVSGFVVRSEKILTADQSIVVCELAEGEHVGGGQAVATVYQSAEARAQRMELLRLQTQLDQLNYASEGLGNRDDSSLDLQIRELLVQSSQYVQSQQLSSALTAAESLQSMVLRRSISEDDGARVNTRITELSARIAELSAAAGQTQSVTVSSSGYFSAAADGLEAILTPEAVLEMNVAQLRKLQSETTAAPASAFGRLILGQKWYFAAEVPADRLEGHYEGDRLTVNFSGESLQNLTMTIERIGENEDGSCVLVLSCERLMQKISALRRQTADIVFETYTGLSVEPQALYYVDGAAGVYVLEGARARFKPVNILYEYADGYVVELDKSDTDNLWPEDEIILTSDDIYNGKVLE